MLRADLFLSFVSFSWRIAAYLDSESRSDIVADTIQFPESDGTSILLFLIDVIPLLFIPIEKGFSLLVHYYQPFDLGAAHPLPDLFFAEPGHLGQLSHCFRAIF